MSLSAYLPPGKRQRAQSPGITQWFQKTLSISGFPRANDTGLTETCHRMGNIILFKQANFIIRQPDTERGNRIINLLCF